jgi:hypothetical protein
MHAPAHVRSAFHDLVAGHEVDGEALFGNEAAQLQWDRMEVEGQLQALAGWLWYCTDSMPAWVCDELGMPRLSTYAEAARIPAMHFFTSANFREFTGMEAQFPRRLLLASILCIEATGCRSMFTCHSRG